MKTIIVGLGNPLLGDDGVGWKVAEQVKADLEKSEQVPTADSTWHVDVECLAVGGLRLMEYLVGYDRAFLIDAIHTGYAPLGSISRFSLENLPNRAVSHLGSSHDTTLQDAIQVGHSVGAYLPEQITIVAVESDNVYDFSEELCPPVASAVAPAASLVLSLITEGVMK